MNEDFVCERFQLLNTQAAELNKKMNEVLDKMNTSTPTEYKLTNAWQSLDAQRLDVNRRLIGFEKQTADVVGIAFVRERLQLMDKEAEYWTTRLDVRIANKVDYWEAYHAIKQYRNDVHHRQVDFERRLAETLTAQLLFHKPENPKQFMIQQLEAAKTLQGDKPLLTEQDFRTMFGMFDVTHRGVLSKAQASAALVSIMGPTATFEAAELDVPDFLKEDVFVSCMLQAVKQQLSYNFSNKGLLPRP